MKNLYLAVVLMGGCFLGAADSHSGMFSRECMPMKNIKKKCRTYCKNLAKEKGYDFQSSFVDEPQSWDKKCAQGEKICSCDKKVIFPDIKGPMHGSTPSETMVHSLPNP